eukprot:CAMPEP_0179005334 /NCGR_PEP_ID=MMETSP0795-20121207/13865_1 /TAXON_ID=88552 /ORGANISM="Amoebophrya sp., Strain Ameob2" /LENGTH=39 /DNA_ID= /DNA_START= /DNA_END= /DNA_ORIENTATION=
MKSRFVSVPPDASLGDSLGPVPPPGTGVVSRVSASATVG